LRTCARIRLAITPSPIYKRVSPPGRRKRYSPTEDEANPSTGIHSDHVIAIQSSAVTGPLRDAVGEALPGTGIALESGPPRNRLPLRTSAELFADDRRYPAGIPPKFSIGDEPDS
jgi:hypothetical protein